MKICELGLLQKENLFWYSLNLNIFFLTCGHLSMNNIVGIQSTDIYIYLFILIYLDDASGFPVKFSAVGPRAHFSV